MGHLSASAKTSAGNFGGSSYTNHKIFKERIQEWRKSQGIERVTVSDDGLSVEASWVNGDKRWMHYTPHVNEVIEQEEMVVNQ